MGEEVRHRMLAKRLLATASLAIWIVCLALVTGPVRWELAHTYEHWVGDAGLDLPSPTVTIALPVLGLGPTTAGTWMVRAAALGLAWLGPLLLLVVIWRASTEAEVTARLLYGGALYASVMVLLAVVVALGLWLPFALL